MSSTYSTNLAIELIGTGDQAGTWGNTTNTNLGTLIEQAISGYVTQAVSTGTDTTITIPNGATGVARNMYIELTGTGGTNTNLIVPANKKLYFIFNNASGAVTVKVSGQTGVSVPAGKKVVLASNGTDTVNALNYIADFGSNSATITQLTATSATITNLTLTSLVISNLSIASANITTLTSSSATISTTLALSGGTANGVLYLDASKVATSGSAVTYNGTTFTTTGAANFATSSGNVVVGATSVSGWPNGKLLVKQSNAGVDGGFSVTSSSNANTTYVSHTGTLATIGADYGSGGSYTPLTFLTGGSERMRLDTSGNLGLGVTPSAWYPTWKAIDVASSGSSLFGTGAIGGISVNAYFDGSLNWIYKSSYSAGRYQIDSGGNHGWSTAPSGTAGNTITFTQAMTLDASGNLGIGTTSFDTRLTVFTGANATQIRFGDNTNSNGYLGNRTGNLCTLHTDQTLAFGTGSATFTERARIDSSGNLLVGTTSGSFHRFHKSSASDFAVQSANTSATTPYVHLLTFTAAAPNDATSMFLRCDDTGVTGRIQLRSNGGIANYQANDVNLSDKRVKTDIKPVGSYWDKIKAIEIVTFKYKDQTHDDDNVGVIAQQVESVAPEFVDVDGFGDTPEDGVPLKTIYTTDMYHAAIKALQEAMTRIEQLEAKVAALENK